MGRTSLRWVSHLDTLSGYPSILSYPTLSVALQRSQWYVHPGPLVLGTNPFQFFYAWQIGTELSHDVLNPLTLLVWPNCLGPAQPQDVMSRHRGADTSSWTLGVSACYPGTLSVERWPFHQSHRITMTVFRLCSTCQSRSQAGLCHCTYERF